MDLSGRHVVVTGAGRGIGAALAHEFRARGARLTVADMHGAQDVAADLDDAVGVDADVSTEGGNVDLIAAAVAAHGPIDLFFANAGVGMGTDPIASTEAEWAVSMAVNFHAHRWAAKHLLPEWLARGAGYFCSTASAAGLLAQIGSAPYSVSKHAAVAFAEWLSITYGDAGLRVTCLCPQGVNTALLDAGDDESGGFALAGKVVKTAGAILEPADVAAAAADGIEAERFLVLPHPEVADYAQVRAAEPERWLAGMRKLQRRVADG